MKVEQKQCPTSISFKAFTKTKSNQMRVKLDKTGLQSDSLAFTLELEQTPRKERTEIAQTDDETLPQRFFDE